MRRSLLAVYKFLHTHFHVTNFKASGLTSMTLGIRCQLAYFDFSLVSGSNFCSFGYSAPAAHKAVKC